MGALQKKTRLSGKISKRQNFFLQTNTFQLTPPFTILYQDISETPSRKYISELIETNMRVLTFKHWSNQGPFDYHGKGTFLIGL